MPLLNREPSIYPEDLLALPTEGAESPPPVLDGPWWVLYTLARQEKSLCRRLMSQEIPFYCPIAPHTTRSPSGRVRTSHVPLFTGYVFLYGDGEARYKAVCTGCVSRSILVSEPAVLTEELRRLDLLIRANRPLETEDHLVPGKRVRVKGGPLEGFQGKIFERRGQTRLLVWIDFIQQGASVEMDRWDLELLD